MESSAPPPEPELHRPPPPGLLRRLYRRLAFVQPLYRRLRRRLSPWLLRRRLRQVLRRGEPCRLVLGAGGKHADGWIATEVYSLNLLRPADWQRLLPEASVTAMVAEHVWEHLTRADGVRAAALCHRYLVPGGHLRIAVPDGFLPSPAYREFVRPGGSGPSAWDHKELYTVATLPAVFEEAGFEVALLEYHDADGTFHARDWDAEGGYVARSERYRSGSRRFDGLPYRSLILDARKPE